MNTTNGSVRHYYVKKDATGKTTRVTKLEYVKRTNKKQVGGELVINNFGSSTNLDDYKNLNDYANAQMKVILVLPYGPSGIMCDPSNEMYETICNKICFVMSKDSSNNTLQAMSYNPPKEDTHKYNNYTDPTVYSVDQTGDHYFINNEANFINNIKTQIAGEIESTLNNYKIFGHQVNINNIKHFSIEGFEGHLGGFQKFVVYEYPGFVIGPNPFMFVNALNFLKIKLSTTFDKSYGVLSLFTQKTFSPATRSFNDVEYKVPIVTTQCINNCASDLKSLCDNMLVEYNMSRASIGGSKKLPKKLPKNR